MAGMQPLQQQTWLISGRASLVSGMRDRCGKGVRQIAAAAGITSGAQTLQWQTSLDVHRHHPSSNNCSGHALTQGVSAHSKVRGHVMPAKAAALAAGSAVMKPIRPVHHQTSSMEGPCCNEPMHMTSMFSRAMHQSQSPQDRSRQRRSSRLMCNTACTAAAMPAGADLGAARVAQAAFLGPQCHWPCQGGAAGPTRQLQTQRAPSQPAGRATND